MNDTLPANVAETPRTFSRIWRNSTNDRPPVTAPGTVRAPSVMTSTTHTSPTKKVKFAW